MSVVGTGIGENPGTAGPPLREDRAEPWHPRRLLSRPSGQGPHGQRRNGGAAMRPQAVRDALRRRGGRSKEHLVD